MRQRFESVKVIALLIVAMSQPVANFAKEPDDQQQKIARPSSQSASIPDWDAGAAANDELRAVARDKSLHHGAKPLVGRILELSNDTTPVDPGANGFAASQPSEIHFVDTFPRSFLGKWNGKATIVRNDYGVLKTRDPAMYKRESHIMYPGRVGVGQVYFELSGDETRAVAPAAEFTPTPADKKYMDLVKQKVSSKAKFDVRFRARDRTTITGTTASSLLTFDHITALTNNVFEEQLATESDVIDRVKNTESRGTQETVLQFHLLDPKQMEVTMATVHYARDGAMESKLLIHGIFSKH